MAGIQIDGVNNKIDFDDDLDTSISANTDDTLVIEAGGNTMATITATTFTINDGTTITTADNTDNLTLKSTDTDANIGPNLRLYRAVAGAASDAIGTIDWAAQDVAGNLQDYASAAVTITDATDGSEDATLTLKVMNAGSLNQMLTISGPETVVNEGSKDHDFRVESNGNVNMLMVNGGSNLVGIGADPDLGAGLHIKTADSGQGTAHASADELVIEGSGNSGINILSANNGEGGIYFGDDGDNDIGRIRYDHANNSLDFFTNAAERMSLASNGGVTITTGDNLDTLTLTSTDADANIGPNLRFYRNSSSPADGDQAGLIRFDARNDNSQDFTAANIFSFVDDASDGTEDGAMLMSIMLGGTARSRIWMGSATAETVFNDDSQDIDFRVESDDDTHMLFIDGGNNKVGIRQSDPNAFTDNYNDLVVGTHSGSNGITIACQNNAQASLAFSTAASGDALHKGRIAYDGANNFMNFSTDGATERMRITNSGRVGIGQGSPGAKLDVETADTNVSALEVHATSGSYSTEVVVFRGTRNTTNSSYKFLACNVPGVNDRLQIVDSGNVVNINNSYGAISDERLKSDIVDANSQWNDIKAIKVRNFKKADSGDMIHLGVVAQELETAGMTGLIQTGNPSEYDIGHNSVFGTLYTADDAETKDGNDQVLYVAEDAEVIDGAYNVGDIKKHATHSKKVGDVKEVSEQVKSVKYSVLYMKAIKALQEAQTRIETLETKVAALEG